MTVKFYSGTNEFDGKEITWPKVIDHGDWWEMDMRPTKAELLERRAIRRRRKNKRKKKG